jgi:hypothetical protein
MVGLWLIMPRHSQALAITQSGGLQVTAFVPLTPPITQAIITNPINPSRFTTTPLVVRGTCGPYLLVRIFDNGQLAGSMTCSVDGDFVINITLNIGANRLTALNYDAQNQSAPASPDVNVTVDPVVVVAGKFLDLGSIASDINTTNPLATPPIDGVSIGESDSQRLFEGTFIDPIAKVAGVSITVSAGVNHTMNWAFNGLLLVAVLGLGMVLIL